MILLREANRSPLFPLTIPNHRGKLTQVIRPGRRLLSILSLALAGCVFFLVGCPAPPLVQPPPSTRSSPSATPQAGAGGAEGAHVWLAPRPTQGRHPDFRDFTAQVPWASAGARIQVLELDWAWAALGIPSADLDRLMPDLASRRIMFAFQAESLVRADRCGAGVPGFAGPPGSARLVAGLAEEGAAARSPGLLVLDSPFAFGHLYGGQSACRWSVPKVAGDVAAYVHAVRGAVLAHFGRVHKPFPGLKIGDAEPLWAGVRPKALESWIAAYHAAAGSELSFFHLEVDFTRPDWAEATRELETFCRKRGIPFGIVYTGQGATDRAFASSAEDRFVAYETKAGGHPDEVVLRSRLGPPGLGFDQSQAEMYAGLIGRYLRTRTTMDMEVGPSVHAGSYRALGTLSSAEGLPVTNADVDVSLSPADGPGSFDTYSLGGVVPAGATAARVGFEVDTGCVCAGRTDFALYGASYTDGGRSANRVPNADFSRGLDGWHVAGPRIERVEPSDRGTGSMLRVRVRRRQQTTVASGAFTVRPGTRFTVSFDARVAPVSVGTGSFVLAFLRSGGELLRATIPFAPISYDLGTATTDETGSFHRTFHPPRTGNFVVHAWFAGDGRLWPAYEEGPVFS